VDYVGLRPSLTSSVVSIYVPPVVVSLWYRVTVSARSAVRRRAFAAAGPMSWNSLPNSLRQSDDCFKHSLKHLSLVDIDIPSAVEVFTTLRYINLHLLTYLLTYLLSTSVPVML